MFSFNNRIAQRLTLLLHHFQQSFKFTARASSPTLKPLKRRYPEPEERDQFRETLQQGDRDSTIEPFPAREVQKMAAEEDPIGKTNGAEKVANEREHEDFANGKEGEEVDGENDQEKQKNQANGSKKRKAKSVEPDGEQSEPAPKRKRGRPKGSGSKKAKSGKTIGSKHDPSGAPAAPASADPLPSKGQKVHWKALPGWVFGTCLEIVKENKEVEGKNVKAKEDDPRIVMRSDNGKVAVHKPQAVYFD